MQLFRYIALVVLFAEGCDTAKKVQVSGVKPVVKTDTATVQVIHERPLYRAAETRLTEVVHTKLEVKFDWAKTYLYGQATLTCRPYFYNEDRVELDARGMDIHEVALLKAEAMPDGRQEKTKLDYTYTGELLKINLDKSYSRQDTFRLFIDYTAKPNELKKKGGSAAISDDKGLYFINPDGKEKDKPREIWTQGETQSNSVWFPCIDKPNEKMTEEIYITVDTNFTTLSNGELVYQKENGDGTRTDYWTMELPHSTYLVMMAVGEFKVVKDKWRDREVNYYMEAAYAPYAKAIFGKTPEMIETFSTLLGVDYPWNKYSQVIVRDYVSGAMENTTATLHGEFLNQTSREMLDKDFEDVISHELFHHWFGDLVTCESWSNIPLNESFATYGEYLWIERKYGREAADGHRREDLDKYMREARRKQVNLVRYDYTDREEVFDRHTYEKGGLILHMLRKYVGDEVFFAALKLYLQTNKFGNAEVANLRMAFEKVCGEDLNWFFNEWFFASGYPDLEITRDYSPISQHYTVTIEQKQDFAKTPLYKLPMDIDLYSEGKVVRKRIVVDKQKQSFEFEAAVQPLFVNVDAEQMVVAKVKDTCQSTAELAYAYHHLPLYENRREALLGLFRNKSSDQYKECIQSALDDPCWELRVLAISGLEPVLKGNENALREKLVGVAGRDPKSLVRGKALTFLSKNFSEPSLISVYRDALKDSSYSVISRGLVALSKADSLEGLRTAKTMEKDKNVQVLFAVMQVYDRYGSDENNDFFVSEQDKFKGQWLSSFVFVYGEFLLRCSDGTVNKGLKLFSGLVTEEDNYLKFSLRTTLTELESMYAKRKKKLEEQISARIEKKEETGDLAAKKEEVEGVLKKIEALVPPKEGKTISSRF